MKFLTPSGTIDLPLPLSSTIAEAAAALHQHPSSAGCTVAHFVANRAVLGSEGCWTDFNLDPEAIIVAVFKPQPAVSSTNSEPAAKDVVRRAVSEARTALGHPVEEDSDSDDSTQVPNFLQAILRERGLGGTGLSALLETLEAVLNRDPPDDDDVPAEYDRERELDRIIPISIELQSQLVEEFGFPETRAKKALWLSKFDVNRAVEWLIGEPDEIQDQPLTAREFRAIKRFFGLTGASQHPTPSAGAGAESMPEAPSVVTGDAMGEEAPPASTAAEPPSSLPQQPNENGGLAEDPDPDLVHYLVEFGFPEEDCISALRQSHNTLDVALAMLLGGGGPLRESMFSMLHNTEETSQHLTDLLRNMMAEGEGAEQ